MSWIQKLHETYEACSGHEGVGIEPLPPICHSTQQAQIEIVIDDSGTFRRASLVEKMDSTTLIPCTEDSASRAGVRPANHPLCDKLQYVAGDFVSYGGAVTSGFAGDPSEPHRRYLADLAAWAQSTSGHPKVRAIHSYVKGGGVIADLVERAHILPLGPDGKLLKTWPKEEPNPPAIFRLMQADQAPEAAFIRWRVEGADHAAETWKDSSLFDSWTSYYESLEATRGLCMVTGVEAALATSLPSKLRHAGDKAKLISSNDSSGFTFRGRFAIPEEAASIGFSVGQKAHNALRWLIARQSFRNGDQVILAWSVSGAPVPDPLADTWSLLGVTEGQTFADTGQQFAIRLSKAIAGYGSRLHPNDDVVVMGLDSATPGRLAITYYREIKGSEFLARVESWHATTAWYQNYGKERKFLGAPAPRDIAEAAFGQRIDAKHRKAVVERLLPCVVDGLPVPADLVKSLVRRASNRVGLERWEFEKCLGVACALYRKQHSDEDYQMSLESERTSRDYLYGRLLAIADHIEGRALWIADEKTRETAAARLMQRFADRPFSTWRTIELSLVPYRARLKTNRGAFLHHMEQTLDGVMGLFKGDDFRKDAPLTGEFLLGYHCQRRDLQPPDAEGAAAGPEPVPPQPTTKN